MRWRIAIAVLVVLGIACGVYVGTQPKKGTVEWHKREYLKAYNGMLERRLSDRLNRAYRMVSGRTGSRMSNADRLAFERTLNSHRRVLMSHGYLAERLFAVEASENTVGNFVGTEMARLQTSDRFTVIIALSTNTVLISAPAADFARWEHSLRTLGPISLIRSR